MQLKQITTSLDGNFVNVILPDKKSIVLKGDRKTKDYIFDVIKAMLGCDYTGVMFENFDINLFNSSASLVFANGELFIRDKAVVSKGNVPKLHYIEYSGGNYIQSFLVTGSTENTLIGYDLTCYTPLISMETWIRLITMVNSLVGFEFVTLTNGKIDFNFDSSVMDEDALKIIYLLIAESFTSPKDYSRLVLIRDFDCIPRNKMGELIEVLDNIGGLERIICSAEISPSSLSKNSVVTFVSI